MRASRNDPCPCGSGLKYKRCHEGKDLDKPRSSGILPLVLFLLLIAAGGTAVVIGIARGGARSSSGRRVWSEEHKHWHEAAPARSEKTAPLDPRSARNAPIAGQPTPLPYDASGPSAVGTPPRGWLWEPEHGHWHPPVSGNTISRITIVPRPTLVTPAPQPAGTPPPGKVWSPEHGHWHTVRRMPGPPVAVTYGAATPP